MSTLLDASSFQTPRGSSTRVQYTRDLERCLIDHGYVRLKNHGISEEQVRQAFEWSHLFFNLPAETKLGILNTPGPNPQRGYSSLGAEKTSSLYGRLMGHDVTEDLRDAREHFDQGSPEDEEFCNRWPEEKAMPGFKQFMTDFYRQCEKASLSILMALEEALDIPSGSFQSRCQPTNASELRLNRYPEIDMKELLAGKVNRIWPHFDLGVITLLFSDGVGGLEFQERQEDGSGVFRPVQEGCQTEIILNISETMQRWTHDRLPASLHQVTIPACMRDQREGAVPTRYSIAYFCKADREASVGALPTFLPSDGSVKYENMTALQYHKTRLETAY